MLSAFPRTGLIGLQIGVVLAATAILHFAPPERGLVLLVPLTSSARLSVVHDAVDAGAALVAAGPTAGSLVVRTDRSGFARRMAATGVLPLAAGAAGCGDARERRS